MATSVSSLYGQQALVYCSDSTYCIPGIAGAPRPKGIIIQQENLLKYHIRTIGAELLNGTSDEIEVSRNKRWTIKGRFPLINKREFKLAVGVNYFLEEFEFTDIAQSSNPLYQNLHDKSLKSYGASIYLSKLFLGNKYLLSRISLTLNGDFNSSEITFEEAIKQSYAFVYGVKLSPARSVAFGINLSNNFGKFGVIPIFAYAASWNNHWLFETILPLKTKFNYISTNKKNVIYAQIQVEGANYRLFFKNDIAGYNKLLLRKTELQFSLNYERELHDWLWVGVEAGLRSNLEFDLTESVFDAKGIVENDINKTAVMSITIFAVPPKNFFD